MRLVLDARARAFLRRVPVTTVYSALELLLIALLAVQCARLVWAVVTPVGPVGNWRPAEPASAPVGILREFDPFFRASGGDAAGPAVVTGLQLTLFGTRVDEVQGGGSAIIAGPDGVQQSIAVGQEIIPGVRLKAVAFDHVTIDRGGAIEQLYLVQADQASAAPPPPAGLPLVGGAPPAASAGGVAPVAAPISTRGITMAQVKADIGFIPRIDGGRVSGLTVRSQGSGAAFRGAGLRDGDVVTAIGGRPVTGPGDIERVAAQYAGGGSVALTVERGGDTLPLVITIAGP